MQAACEIYRKNGLVVSEKYFENLGRQLTSDVWPTSLNDLDI